jgi:SH3 domain-containing protein
VFSSKEYCVKRICSTLLGATCLLLTATNAFAQSARARIAATPIRAEASVTSAMVAMLNEGDPIDVVEEQGSWYRVLVPGTQETPQVGYVQAQLVEIVDGDGSVPQRAAAPANRAAKTQGPQIPPTAMQIQQRELRAKAAAREQALKSQVDSLQATLDALQTGQTVSQSDDSGQMPQASAPGFQKREGVWFNAGFGLGMLSCLECDGWLNGFSGGLSAGKAVTDRLLIGVGTTGYHRSVVGIGFNAGSVVDARLRFYPIRSSSFFLTGGMGLGSISVADASEYGLSAVFGVGYDVKVTPKVSLTPFWNGTGVVTSSANASVGQVGLGITIR